MTDDSIVSDELLELASRTTTVLDSYAAGKLTWKQFEDMMSLISARVLALTCPEESRPLKPVLDRLAREMDFEYDGDDPFGGLPIIPEDERAEPGAHSDTCYICRDPSYAERGLPLCRACPACGGHIAADDNRCEVCGLIDQHFWEVEREAVKEMWTTQQVFDALDHCFEDKDYEKVQPTDDQLGAARVAMLGVLRERERSAGSPGGLG